MIQGPPGRGKKFWTSLSLGKRGETLHRISESRRVHENLSHPDAAWFTATVCIRATRGNAPRRRAACVKQAPAAAQAGRCGVARARSSVKARSGVHVTTCRRAVFEVISHTRHYGPANVMQTRERARCGCARILRRPGVRLPRRSGNLRAYRDAPWLPLRSRRTPLASSPPNTTTTDSASSDLTAAGTPTGEGTGRRPA